MNRPIFFESLDAMLAPDALGALVGSPVASVTSNLWNVNHLSGNALFEVWLETDAGRSRLILKRFQPARDWVMRLTHDTQTREVQLFLQGIFAQLPHQITVPIIAAARTEHGWATLMYDVSPSLLPSNQMLDTQQARTLLENLAALHAHLWDDVALENPALGLSSLNDFLSILSPRIVQRELAAGQTHPVLEMAARGWQQFTTTAPDDIQNIIHSLQQDHTALRDRLERMPQTLVHGDFKLGNLGLARDNSNIWRTIILDWQDATRGAGVLDLGYFLALNARWLPFPKETAIQIYTDALESRGCSVLLHDVEIGCLAGGALRLLWLMVNHARADWNWWYDLMRRAATYL